MKVNRLLIFLILFPGLVQAARLDCTQLEGPGNNVGVADNGKLYVTTNRGPKNLPLASQKGNVERYRHQGFECDHDYTATKENGKVKTLNMSSNCLWGMDGPEITYELGHDDQGCYVKRAVKDDVVVYEIELCEKLVKMQNQFGPDAARCNDLLSQMSKTLKEYQESIKKSGLTMPYGGAARDFYQAALDQTAECRRRLAFSSKNAQTSTGSASVQQKTPSSAK